MNNFRHHPKPSFGIRGAQQNSELPNPWMTEEELSNMRRQNPQFQPFVQNMPPAIQSPILNQSQMLPASNKNYINDNSYKMNNTSFTHSPNPDIFKPLPPMNESHYPNRLPNDRFSSSNSFSNVNMQYKMNEGPMFRDFPGSNMMPPQSHKNDGFMENVSKPLYTNMRQPQERFSCMQNDQSQFHSKYDNTQMFQGKRFPFSGDKDLLSHNTVSFLDKAPNTVGNNVLPFKSNFRTPSLFPAYTPKDVQDESPKTVPTSNYNSDFLASTSLCDKTVLSSRYSKSVPSFQEKTDPFQKNVPEKVMNDLFPQHNNASSYMYDNQSFKALPSHPSQESFKAVVEPSNSSSNKYPFTSESQQPCFQSPIQQDSFKTVGTPTSSNSKFPFTSESQQSCFQSSNEGHFQRSQTMQIPDHSSAPPSSASSKDCLMQNPPLISQADVNQTLKDNFSSSNCSFNFESNINATDIADLLPGLDAFLKETFNNKSDDIFPKNESKGNSAFSDDEWTKHSIPFIGDNQAASSSVDVQNEDSKESYCGQTTPLKDKCNEKCDVKVEKANEVKSSDDILVDNSISAGDNVEKGATIEKNSSKIHSVLEEAIEMLVSNDAIVGLDYIIEFKKNISQQGSFPFRCKLCNSAITRPSIIDHVLGLKHRMRYLKAKDESKYEYIVALKIEKSQKDAKIAEAAFELEKLHGRGHVVVNTEEYQKDSVNMQNISNTSADEGDEKIVETVFTLDKIPIGFEALSPEHDDTHSTNFTLDTTLNSELTEAPNNNAQKENVAVSTTTEVNRVIQNEVSPESAISLPGLDSKSCSNDKSYPVLPLNNVESDSVLNKESDAKDFQKSSESFLSNQNKRAASPEFSSRTKQQKIDETSNSFKPCADVLTEQKVPEIKDEKSPLKEKVFCFSLFEDLSNCVISSEEEATIAVQTIDILLQMLLKYKLQHVPLEVMEKMMSSLQSRSPDKVEELISFLNDSKMLQVKKEEVSVESTTQKSEVSVQDDSEEKINQVLANQIKSSDLNFESNMPSNNTLDGCGTVVSLSSSIGSVSASNAVVNNINFPAPQTNTPVTYDNTVDVSKNVLTNAVVDSISIPQTVTSVSSQAANPVCLKPPPFFNWSQTNETANQASYVAAQGNQNMMWATQYQHSQTQYTQMPYYQQQNYGSTFSGPQAYQTQFSAMPQNSMPLKMVANPPLPPPPPPPPPAPVPAPAQCNPPLPPLPNHNMYSSATTSHSVPLPSNPPRIHTFSKPPPPPPPLP